MGSGRALLRNIFINRSDCRDRIIIVISKAVQIISCLVLALVSCVALATTKVSLGVAFNQAGSSTSTSNPTEGYIRKGVELGLAQLGSKENLNPNVFWVDHGESVAQTLEAIEKLNSRKPRIVVGMGNSFQALLSAERLDRSIVLISPVATSDEILRKSDRILLLSNPNSVQAKMLAKEIFSRKSDAQKVLLISLVGCPYCTDMSAAVKKELSLLGVKVSEISIHAARLADSSETLKSVTGFDHIVLPVFEADAARLISALNVKNRTAIFWGADGWGTLARFIKELPCAPDVKVMWLSHYFDEIDNHENVEFVKKFRSKYGISPVDTAAFYFEATLIAGPLLRAGNADKVLRNFRKLRSYSGLTGQVKILDRHVIRGMPLLTLVGGTVKMVKVLVPSEAYATRE